jgi:hypothetical protein
LFNNIITERGFSLIWHVRSLRHPANI